MQNEVYADLLFLVNFSMDFLCFYICARLLHRPLRLWRGVVASALGGGYAIVALLLSMGRWGGLLLDMAVCAVLCAVALRCRGGRMVSLLRITGLYLLISSVLGGVMTMLFSEINQIPGVTQQVTQEGISAWLFLGMALLSTLLTWLWGRGFRRSASRRRVTVIVEQSGKQAELSGIFDSGNLLRDPIGGKVVIPSGAKALRGVVPPPVLRAACSGRMAVEMEALPPDLMRQVRLIPARGATGEALMLGWSPEHVYLRDEGDSARREVDALIAPNAHLSGADGIAAIVPQELMSI